MVRTLIALLTALALAGCVLMGGVVEAAEARSRTTTGDLLRACKSRDLVEQGRGDSLSLGEWGYCLGYLVGFVDGHDGASVFNPFAPSGDQSHPILWCVPQESKIDVRQVRAVFVKWAEAHPERWHENRAIGLLEALREAWPCKR